MNFTREPIIETVITPREGCKLVVRSSKGNGSEDYFVDAVEVVSFGHSFFFRSLERPKSFLVPVSDYEILEFKETRMVLKNASTDRSVKIGGGKAASQELDATLSESRPAPEPHADRKRDKRRRSRRGGREREQRQPEPEKAQADAQNSVEQGTMSEPFPMEAPPAEEKSPSFISKLFPPPPTLIKESLARYKPVEGSEESVSGEEETSFEHPTRPDSEEDEEQ